MENVNNLVLYGPIDVANNAPIPKGNKYSEILWWIFGSVSAVGLISWLAITIHYKSEEKKKEQANDSEKNN
jgi:hypothetical protein